MVEPLVSSGEQALWDAVPPTRAEIFLPALGVACVAGAIPLPFFPSSLSPTPYPFRHLPRRLLSEYP